MTRVVLSLLVFVAFALPAKAQDIVAEMSQYEVELSPSFHGQDLFLFGAIRAERAELEQGFDIVVVVKGQARPHMVRKKERIFGLWLNTESRVFEDVPEYFAQASTRPLAEITYPETLHNLDLGLDRQDFAAGNADPDFVAGLIREKVRAGMYNMLVEDMAVKDKILFRADFSFPPKVPSGTYHATAYLFQNGNLVGRSDREIHVDQVGLARALYVLAHENSALYGILAVLLALGAGSLAGYITRRRPKLG